MLKFSANVSTLFPDIPFLKRFEEAKKCGFSHVELQSFNNHSFSDVRDHLSGMKLDLVNSMTSAGYCGYASIPGHEVLFCDSLTQLVSYYPLGFQKVHILAGNRDPKFSVDEQFNAFVNALDSATEILENFNWIGLIEPICPEVKEDYFLQSFEMAIKALEKTYNPNVKLLLDVYHLHMITGDVQENLKKYYPYSGHIQISQDPGRREPFFPGGKIDYNFVFNFLKEKNHQDVIGLEYFPSKPTKETLDWIKNI